MREVDSELGLELWVSDQETVSGWEWCVVQWSTCGDKDWEVFGHETDFIGASATASMEFWRRQVELRK